MLMNKVRIYNDDEIKKLLSNPNVLSIRNKSQIQYKNDFKLRAVLTKIKYPEKTSREIFEDNGFDMSILDDRTPQKRLCMWTKKYKMFGKEYFTSDNKYSYKALEKNITDNSNLYVIEIQKGSLVIKKTNKSNNEKTNN